VADDVKEIGKATQKAAKDIGRATTDLADKAGRRVEEASDKAAVGSQDAWITTKVKSALTAAGVDALHVHVDTKAKVVTLSGAVDSAAQKAKAVGIARGVADVSEVQDHLFVNAAGR
jgi:osmotically-inducible protein OsmY